ncbi:MAG: HAMP domain-containing sensor histidine kinase [Acidimicrobiia bacterium]
MELDKKIKLIATATAAATFVVFSLAWLIEPFETFAVSAIASLAAFVVFGTVWRFERAPSITIVITSMALTIGVAAVMSDPSVDVGAAVAIVTMSIVGIELIRSRHVLYITTVAGVLLVYPLPLSADLTIGIANALIGTACFLLGAFVLRAVSQERETLVKEHATLFDLAPVLILEGDWSEAERRVNALGIRDPDELRAFLIAHPETVAQLVGTVDVIAANPFAREAVGVSGDAGWRMDPSRVHPDSLAAFAEQLVSIAADRPLHDFEYETTKNDGSPFIVSLSSAMYRTPSGAPRVFVAAQDITERKTSQIALRRALAAKDAFIAEISHELRTPLSAVVGLSASLLEGARLLPEDRELLAMVSQQAEEMARIIDDLLVAAQADNRTLTVDRRAVDVCSEAEAVAAGTGAEVECADMSVMANADPVRVRQIIRNLLTNAARYGRSPVTVDIAANGSQVTIDVSDTGDPIPEEARERIFEPYQTAHEDSSSGGSIGLGLAVSRTLAHLMGGDLTYSHNGRSTFTLTLPRHVEDRPTA